MRTLEWLAERIRLARQELAERGGRCAMSVIFSRAPLRISLGGGGTDLPSYYREHGGFLVSGAIDKYVYMLTHTVFQRRYRMKYSEMEEVDEISEIRHPILRETLLRHWRGNPLEIASVADVPAGTGMGSSGAYTVCLLKGLAHARRTSITPGALAEAACEIEIDVLGEPVGKQDPYVAAHGGICAYTFHPDGTVEVEPLELDAGDAAAAARPAAAVLHRRGALGLEGPRRPGRALEGRRRGDAREPASHQGARAPAATSCSKQGDLEAYAELMHEHWETQAPALAGHGQRAHRPALHARPAQRCDRRQARRRRRRRVPAGLRPPPEDTRQAMAAAGAPELAFDFEFAGAYASEIRMSPPTARGDRRLRPDRTQASRGD